jgi:hypothetical protein
MMKRRRIVRAWDPIRAIIRAGGAKIRVLRRYVDTAETHKKSAASGFQLLLVDAGTGKYISFQEKSLASEGARFANPQVAAKRAEEILQGFPYATAVVTDLATGAQERFNHPDQGDYMHEKYKYLHWRNLPWWRRLFKRAPTCKFFDPSHFKRDED